MSESRRRYTGVLLMIAGLVISGLMALLNVAWWLIGGVFAAFLFGAALAFRRLPLTECAGRRRTP